MGRQPCCDKVGLKRGPWTIEEDQKLVSFILNNGIQCWRLVPKLAGLLRCGKSCRLRWMNYLRPDLKRGALTEAEENQIIELHSRLGNKWSKIAGHFPGRTDNEIKNHWNTRIKRKLKSLGIDPQTHKQLIMDSDDTQHATPRNHEPSDDNEPTASDAQLGLQDNKIETGLDRCCSSGNLQTSERSSKESDAKTDKSSESGSSGLDDCFLNDDSQQHWFDGIDYLLSWDGLNSNFDEIFRFDSHQ